MDTRKRARLAKMRNVYARMTLEGKMTRNPWRLFCNCGTEQRPILSLNPHSEELSLISSTGKYQGNGIRSQNIVVKSLSCDGYIRGLSHLSGTWLVLLFLWFYSRWEEWLGVVERPCEPHTTLAQSAGPRAGALSRPMACSWVLTNRPLWHVFRLLQNQHAYLLGINGCSSKFQDPKTIVLASWAKWTCFVLNKGKLAF